MEALAAAYGERDEMDEEVISALERSHLDAATGPTADLWAAAAAAAAASDVAESAADEALARRLQAEAAEEHRLAQQLAASDLAYAQRLDLGHSVEPFHYDEAYAEPYHSLHDEEYERRLDCDETDGDERGGGMGDPSGDLAPDEARRRDDRGEAADGRYARELAVDESAGAAEEAAGALEAADAEYARRLARESFEEARRRSSDKAADEEYARALEREEENTSP